MNRLLFDVIGVAPCWPPEEGRLKHRVPVITSVFSSTELKRRRTDVFLRRIPNGFSGFPSTTTELPVSYRMENLGLWFHCLSKDKIKMALEIIQLKFRALKQAMDKKPKNLHDVPLNDLTF